MKQLHHGLLPFTITRSACGPSCVINERNPGKVEYGENKTGASKPVPRWTKQVFSVRAIEGVAGMTEPIRNRR